MSKLHEYLEMVKKPLPSTPEEMDATPYLYMRVKATYEDDIAVIRIGDLMSYLNKNPKEKDALIKSKDLENQIKSMQDEDRKRDEELRKQGGFAGITSNKYAEQLILVEKWCKKNKASYYSEEKHKFSTSSAVRQAKKENKKAVVVENLS